MYGRGNTGNSAGGLGGLEAGRLDIPTLRERRRFYRICPNVANMFLHYCNCLTYKVIRSFRAQEQHNKVNLRTERYPHIVRYCLSKGLVSGSLATFADSISVNRRASTTGQRPNSRALFSAGNTANQRSGANAACCG